MRTRTVRLLTLSASTLLALAAAWLVLRARAPAGIGVLDQTRSVDEVLLARSVAPRGLGPFELRAALPRLVREPLDEATVRRIFPVGPAHEWDAHVHFRYRANLDLPVPLAGHAGGEFRLRTNSQGYREDREFPAPPPDLLVVATGDSHTDGLCENAATWPARLEERLARERPGATVEVLNTGVQLYSFYHYLGAVERELPRRPAAFVTLCYGGNDFLEVLLLHHMHQKTIQPPRTRDYWDALTRAPGVGPPELTQILYSLHYFERFPDEADRALDAASAVTLEIQRLCGENGAAWVFAYLPSAYCLDWRDRVEERARDLAALGLDQAALVRHQRMPDRLLALLRERGVSVLDLREPLRALAARGEDAPYWSEFHLDLRGLDLVAGWIAGPLEAALATRDARR